MTQSPSEFSRYGEYKVLKETYRVPKNLTTLVVYGVVAAIAVGFLAAMLLVQGRTLGTVANFANLLPFGYAFAAGMVASVNPCGFIMLPSYISYHLGSEETGFYESPASARLLRAIALALVATGGFIAIFALVGYIVALGGRWLITLFPIGGLIIGIIMASIGVWLLITGKPLGIMAASRLTVSSQKNMRNVFLFGIIYAIGSLQVQRTSLPDFHPGQRSASLGFL